MYQGAEVSTIAIACPICYFFLTVARPVQNETKLISFFPNAVVDFCSIPCRHTLLFVGRWPLEVLGQTAAHVSGLAYLSHLTKHCLHPKFGPWVGLRAVLVVDCAGPEVPPPAFPFELTDEFICGSDSQPQMGASSVVEIFRKVSEASKAQLADKKWEGLVLDNWKDWVALRDAFEIGQEHAVQRGPKDGHS